ncbi:tRNA pseudouridine(38-40) synthase TruA [Bacteriovorax sp. Seq25_V]|uniref:tRNA pseudouridine(38-40) synthase TruA n=1 Tax=Bacteriovorax sp. Seq25_V TaxID=1201288 RepID=UPI00038A0830|nr:tRNA pseudouridine(38-40) synthase TruA [Bacteriovorax sp. Seq25_V]EQC44681.1 tRNA pseudouridine(38-40) synthase [Bacteriovorax sp. Seq25_V]
MNFYKAIVSYKGTQFSGWQKQPDQISIQGEIEKVVAKISNCKISDIQIIGSGRTDTGVHALGQAIRIATPLRIESSAFKKAINSLIHADIKLKEVEVASEDFNPVFDAIEKEYHYYFSTSKDISPHYQELLTFLNQELDLELMNQACSLFIGEHDFENFRTVGTPVKSTVRTITECRVEKVSHHIFDFPENTFVLKIKGNGFLKQMVRLIMASVWSVGSSKKSIEDLRDYMAIQSTQKFAPTAPPQGLYLVQVSY